MEKEREESEKRVDPLMSKKPLKKISSLCPDFPSRQLTQSFNFNIHKNQNQIPAVLCMGGQVCQLLSGEPEKHLCHINKKTAVCIVAEHFLGETLDSETITFN